MSDEFDGIFDHLTIEDFITSTTAVEEVLRSNQGLEAFTAFVEEQLRTVRTAWVASETWMQPIALLANHEKQRVFTPDDDESLGDFVNRLSREARSMEAIWSFVAKRTYVADLGMARTSELGDVSSEADPDAWERAVAEGVAELGVLWYAERNEGTERHHRHGQMVDSNGRLGPLIEGSPNQTLDLFARILNPH